MAAILQAEAVAYRYPQNNYGLTPISLTAQPGQRLLVAGPSGCGKSTLARCLAGLIPHLYRGALEGGVWLDGLHTADTPLWHLAERAGFVALGLARSLVGYIIFGALGGLLGALTLAALRKAGFFAYLAEKK